MRLQPARHRRLADAVLHRQRFQASASPIRSAHIQQLLPRELDWAVHFFDLDMRMQNTMASNVATKRIDMTVSAAS